MLEADDADSRKELTQEPLADKKNKCTNVIDKRFFFVYNKNTVWR